MGDVSEIAHAVHGLIHALQNACDARDQIVVTLSRGDGMRLAARIDAKNALVRDANLRGAPPPGTMAWVLIDAVRFQWPANEDSDIGNG